MITFLSQQRLWLWPILAMAILTPFTPWLDLTISGYFFRDGSFSTNGIYTFIYNYLLLPAQLTFIAATVVLLISYLVKSWKPWRKMALVMVLTMVIGSGLLTNAMLKDHWGRPRPKQTVEFNGTQNFRPYYSPNFFHQPEPSKSFPCGHCSMGFYFFGLTLIGIRTHRKTLAWASFAAAILMGGILALARIAQGGHFFSDVLASALIMWLTAYMCTYAFIEE
jgi:membrane-associated PAP2 superfamily phosphatase